MADERPPETRARFTIRGRVQGVGYRWWTMRVARELGITAGWVTNLPDGGVEVVATGTPDAVAKLEERLAEGPRGARVEGVEKMLISHEVYVSNSFIIK